jgi:hypothetical protein
VGIGDVEHLQPVAHADGDGGADLVGELLHQRPRHLADAQPVEDGIASESPAGPS